MQSVQADRLNTFRAASSFLDEYGHVVPGIATSGARMRLAAVVSEIENLQRLQAEKTTEMRVATARMRALRRTLLLQHMAPIASIARLDQEDVLPTTALRMPRGNPNVLKLLTAASNMVGAAEHSAPTFLAAGLPRDFAERLREVAAELYEESITAELRAARRNEATKEIAVKLAEARRVLDVLSTMMRGVADREGIPLTSWDVAKRVSAGAPGVRRLKAGDVAQPRLVADTASGPPGNSSDGIESAA